MHFPLELFRREMAIHPYRFWQQADAIIPYGQGGTTLTFQHAWQQEDTIGRADMQRSLDDTVAKLTDWLHYSPLQHYATQQLPWPIYQDVKVGRYPFLDARQHWLNVRLREGYIQQLGVEALALINDIATVVYTDVNGDGLNDTFTVTQATALTDPAAIAVYFSSADRTPGAAEMDDSRILPISVTITGGNAVIIGPSWMLVKPALFEGVSPTTLDPANMANFVTTLAVYQRSTYTAGQTFSDAQATLEYETRPCPWWGWCSSPTNGSTDPAVVGYAVARAGIHDARLGYVTPVKEAYDATTGIWSADPLWTCNWQPDRVTVRYFAGYPLTPVNQVDPLMAQLVARMGAAEMGRDIPALQGVNREVYRWQFDLAKVAGQGEEAYGISPDDLNNPFGTRRGHVWAWRTVKRLATLSAVIA